ncbi:2Fe-2S iron-sulfur cluster binding domain-containing protein [Ammoniphilus sp. CFH 90114]|uniref:2Fe-2S iron-sulfur cluster binding domain-containing protein n=1 Tax=Ammoniphilus sp. CFH 90114 TaxID=2493665 RepID=UPI00100F906A|nr:2Fe-2S iron-sulfur cluster-binding protein [Ammoniphilus sp. CFH 90114]RXT08777.1 (2Fe-2S)-binding protein [Ammoniphilus sp. CFH 90114]
MKQLSISVFNNDCKRFSLDYQPGLLLLETVNEPFSDPKREGIPFICRKGACRSCVVHVLEGSELLVPPTPLEQRALQVGKTTIAGGYRLACMTRFKEELE